MPDESERLTSTAAFRKYMTEVDAVVRRFDQGDISELQAWESYYPWLTMVQKAMVAAFRARLESSPAAEDEDDEPRRIETYPVPLLRDLAGQSSYVHRAHTPGADQGGKPSSPGADPENCRCDAGDYCVVHRLGGRAGAE